MTNIEPIRKLVVVEATQARAFRVFTEEHGAWWPLVTHHIGEKAAETAIIEPHVGGRWFERAEDGTECMWGHVRVWNPPGRLVLSWEIGSDWKHDPSLITEVDVRFVVLGPVQTRIELEHRLLENFGDTAAAKRDLMDGGWGRILDLYASAAGAR